MMPNQLTQKISATELARNLATVIDQVRVERQPMTITRGNQDIAQIVPLLNSSINLSDLSLLLKKQRLSQQQKKNFLNDLSHLRQSSSLPRSDWD